MASEFIDSIPQQPQRQDSVMEQLADLRVAANKLGLHDAADAIRQAFPSVESIKYGCHCDLDDGMAPDGCVIDEGRRRDCIYARKIERKEQCEYWRIVL